jgi:hypothetical protein
MNNELRIVKLLRQPGLLHHSKFIIDNSLFCKVLAGKFDGLVAGSNLPGGLGFLDEGQQTADRPAGGQT